MEQIRKTALLKEKKKKEKEARYLQSLVLSRMSSSQQSQLMARSAFQLENPEPQMEASFLQLDRITVKDLDTNEEETLKQASNKIQKKVTHIDLPLDVRQAFWDSYMTGLTKQQEHFLEVCASGDIVQLDRILDPKNPYPIDINFLSEERRNCLHVAINCNGTTDTIRKLLYKGADINHKNQQGRTPLIVAVIRDLQDIVKLLLQFKCLVDLQDTYGNTALHYGCMYNYDKLVEILVSFGASQKITNNEKQTALQTCIHPNTVTLLDRSDVDTLMETRAQYSRTITEDCILGNNRVDHINRILSLAEKSKSQPEEAEPQKKMQKSSAFKKRKTTFSRYQAMANRISVKEPPKEIRQVSLLEFKHIDTLGRGAFGAVYLVQQQSTGKKFALKILSKQQIEAQKLLRYALTERKILSTIDHPFVVKLHYAYQTHDKLIFVMDYCPGGDLLDLVKKHKKLDQALVKKFAAEIVLALECLHKAQIIYRDLKPANVVIDSEGHARLTDFGLAKEADMTHSFCGSLAYLSPEMLSRRGHTRTLDWYLLGVLIYECYTGKPPFYDPNKAELLNNIKVGKFKPFEASAEMKDIVTQLLRSNINKRLGNQNDAEQVKQHPWFKDINWKQVLQRKQLMPIPANARDILSSKAKRSQIFTEQEIQMGKTVNHIKGWQYQSC